MADTFLVQEDPRGASQLIEIPVVTGATRVPIPDVPQLRSYANFQVVIKAVRLIPDSVIAVAPTQGGITAPISDLVNMTLTIYSQGWEKGFLIPILTLNDTAQFGATPVPFRFNTTRLNDWKNVDWPKSYLQFSNGTSASQNFTVLLEVEYQRFDMQGKPVEGAM